MRIVGTLTVCAIILTLAGYAAAQGTTGPKTTAVSRQVDAEAAQERRAFWHYMERCR
jgi:hypothetical protein